jgi:small nuclear ribonucleoprotein (snRNP)-like protein
MTEKYQFQAVIEDAGGGGAYVTIPFDVEKAFGKKRVKIKATIDGETYRGTLVRMGSPQHMLLVLKEIREKVGKSFGDNVTVELEEDFEPRQVEVPADLQLALETDPTAQASFNRLSYSHQKEYVRWIMEAKREQTRQRRIQQAIEMLQQGKNGH